MTVQPPRIAIAIVTYQRPLSLADTLRSLAVLQLPPAELCLIVIDNDAAESARSTVESLAPQIPFPVAYHVEKTRGIPAARNRALDEARSSDLLAFIDDDDTADPRWLVALYNTLESYGADVVRGQIVYQFPPQKAHWQGLDVFARTPAPTGSALDSAWTGNVLFRTQLYQQSYFTFDAAFTASGGSDHHFFRSLKQRGAKIVLCQEAIVYSPLSPARATLGWLIRRNLRVGATLTLSDIRTHGYHHAWRGVRASLADSAGYFLRLMRGACKGTVPLVHPAMVLCFAAGRLMGLAHSTPREYR